MIETILSVIGVAFPLVFTSNIVMAAVKYLADGALTKTGLRVMLGLIAVIGAIATAAFTGEPIDFNQVSDIALLTIQTAVIGVGAHFSYKLIKQ